MSEFKFACPVCGQHITADSSTSGGQIECPTCFRKIVVPQAPTSTDARLIISASQADKPRPTQAGPSLDPISPARRAFPVAGLFLGIVVVAAATAFALRDKIFRSGSTHPAAGENASSNAVSVAKTYPVPTDLKWSLDIKELAVPEKPAVGRIHGSGFKCERAVLQGGTLNLRQGKSGSPVDLGVSIHLFAQQGEELSNKSIEVTPQRSPPLPKVVLRWKDDADKPVTRSITRGYALKLTFGEAVNSRIPGKIYICLPDEHESFVAGTFTAEIRKPSPPKQKQPKVPKAQTSG